MDYEDFLRNVPDVDQEILAENPIAQKVFMLAQDHGIKLNNYKALAKIIDGLDNESLTDAKSIIIIAELIERLINLTICINKDN